MPEMSKNNLAGQKQEVMKLPEPPKLAWTLAGQGTFTAEDFMRCEFMMKNLPLSITHEKKLGYDDVDLESQSSSESRDWDASTLNSTNSPSLELPGKRQSKLFRNLRYISFNVYRRLFSIVFISNMIALFVFLGQTPGTGIKSISAAATAASANLLVSIMIRQDYVVNSIYRICWAVPHSWSVRTRCLIAKTHELGGIHSGMQNHHLLPHFEK